MRKQRGYTLIDLVIIICTLLTLSALGLVLFVFFHFVMKFW